jgi:hypothetical protein
MNDSSFKDMCATHTKIVGASSKANKASKMLFSEFARTDACKRAEQEREGSHGWRGIDKTSSAARPAVGSQKFSKNCMKYSEPQRSAGDGRKILLIQRTRHRQNQKVQRLQKENQNHHAGLAHSFLCALQSPRWHSTEQ